MEPGRHASAYGPVRMVVFYLLSLGLSWSAMLLWRLPEGWQPGDVAAARDVYARVGLLFGFGPMVAALMVSAASGRGGLKALVARVGIVRVHPLWYLAALVLPVLPQWAGAIAWSAVSGDLLTRPDLGVWAARWLQLSVAHGVFSIGEELGWRGFLLPRVADRAGWLRASLVVGVAWAIWHYPLWFMANWAASGSLSHALLVLALASCSTIGFSVLMTWVLAHARGSVLLAMAFHGSVNANMNLVYEQMSDDVLLSLGLPASIAAATLLAAAIVAALGQRGTSRSRPATAP